VPRRTTRQDGSRWPVREATARDLRLELSWTHNAMRSSGRLTAYNVSDVVVSVSGKPVLRPKLSDSRIPTNHVVTAEAKTPPFVALGPRETAVAPVTMFGWGSARVESIVVEVGNARFVLEARGFQPQPEVMSECLTSSDWFQLER
jgi:hypothetical protein